MDIVKKFALMGDIVYICKKIKRLVYMKRFVVEFKENYMPHSVVRVCMVGSEEEVKRIYGLDEGDIEWYKITEVKDDID